MDKFEEKRKEAWHQLSILAEMPIEDSPQGIADAKARIYHHGDCNDKAKADVIAEQYMWAYCEEWYHSQAK